MPSVQVLRAGWTTFPTSVVTHRQPDQELREAPTLAAEDEGRLVRV
jgi:hypothetical protein